MSFEQQVTRRELPQKTIEIDDGSLNDKEKEALRTLILAEDYTAP